MLLTYPLMFELRQQTPNNIAELPLVLTGCRLSVDRCMLEKTGNIDS